MFGGMGQSAVKNLGNGGTMDGDVTITGDLTVNGGIGLSLSEVIQGTSTIDITNTEAFLIRRNGDGGDIFTVDTTNAKIIASHNDNISIVIKSTEATRNGILSFENSADSKNFEFKHNSFDPEAGTNQLEINSTDTANIMVFNLDGKIGLGTANPSTLLNLESATSTAITAENTGNSAVALNLDANRSGADQGLGNINFKWNGTTVAQISGASGADTTNKDDGQIQFSTSSGGSSSVNMTLDKDGNVGIGIAPVLNKLHLHEGDSTYNFLHITNTTTGTTHDDGLLVGLDSDEQANIWNRENTSTLFATNNTQRMEISADGDVGIGCSPSAGVRLRVEDTNAIMRLQASNDGGNVEFLMYPDQATDNADLRTIKVVDGGTMTFNSYRSGAFLSDLTLDGATGKVGIGTTSPSVALDVSGQLKVATNTDSATAGVIRNTHATGYGLKINGASDSTRYALTVNDNDDDTVFMRVLGNGKTGIGTSAPGNTLHVSDGSSTVSNNDQGITITDADNGKLIFEDSGEGTNDKLMMLNHYDESLKIQSINDAQDDWVNYQIATFQRDGKVGFGTLYPDNNVSIEDSGDTIVNIDSYSDTTSNVAVLKFRKSHNDTAGTITQTTSGHYLGFLGFEGVNSNSAFSRGAYVTAIQTGTSGSTYVPAKLHFGVSSSSASLTSMVIDENSRISLSNNDTSATGGGDSSSGNTIIGYLAGNTLFGSSHGGYQSVIIGHRAGEDVTTGDNNLPSHLEHH